MIRDFVKWRLTADPPAVVHDIIDGELEVFRHRLVDVVRRTRRTPINAAAAVYALADAAAYVLGSG